MAGSRRPRVQFDARDLVLERMSAHFCEEGPGGNIRRRFTNRRRLSIQTTIQLSQLKRLHDRFHAIQFVLTRLLTSPIPSAIVSSTDVPCVSVVCEGQGYDEYNSLKGFLNCFLDSDRHPRPRIRSRHEGSIPGLRLSVNLSPGDSFDSLDSGRYEGIR